MDIKITIDLNDKESKLMSRILEAGSEVELKTKLEKVATAATEEYKAMIIGQKVFTRGKDMQEFRLLNLVNHYFDHQIPSEQEICALFQIRATEAKSLINAITSKYQYELEENIHKTISGILRGSTQDGKTNKFPLSLRSAYLKDEINRLIFIISPDLPLLERDITTGGKFLLAESSYQELLKYVTK